MLVILDTQSNIHLMFKIANDLRGDLNTGIFFPSADTIAFTEGGAEAMRIDSSGNVGIKTTTPATELDISSGAITGGTKRYITLTSLNNSSAEIGYADIGVTFNQNVAGNESGGMNFRCFHDGTIRNRYIFGAGAGDVHQFFTGADSERMRIDSNGNVLVGTTSSPVTARIASSFLSSSSIFGSVFIDSQSNNTAIFCQFRNNTGALGSITNNNNTGTAYNTSSDYRLKENVNYNFDATTRLKQLKPARFNFIVNPNKTVDGFLAHEVQDIIPEAIHGTKDQTLIKEKVVINSNGGVIAENIEQADWEAGKIPNEEGKSQYPVDSTWEASKVVPVYQGIDQAKLTPILTKALQEAIARIEQLEARLTALES